jgi:hypothetical protein
MMILPAGLLGWIMSSLVILTTSSGRDESKASLADEECGKIADDKVLLFSWGFYASLAGE